MTIPYCSHILYNLWIFCFLWERFEDTKWVIRIRKSKNRQNNDQKEKVQKNKQRSTKHTHKTKDRVTRTPLKTGGELGCFGRVSNSCSTNGNRRVNLVTNPAIICEWGKDRGVLAVSGTCPWTFVTQIFHSVQPSHSDDFNFTKRNPWFNSFLVSSNPLSRKSLKEPLIFKRFKL